ncbi:unnamed protein product [Clonostachys solani]|uniref:Uncharacterized protein n=1 Tax=Clonostachys solani TaxID=160281 RepID=A0A9N9Z1D0_9HYPO|nr:unnamed protein product [Clonostachys solani]
MTTATFQHIDTSSYEGKPWSKVDGPGKSYIDRPHQRTVSSLRGRETDFSLNANGFAIIHSPAIEKLFASDEAVRGGYYGEVEALIRKHIPERLKKVEIFDHTVRRRQANSPRQPVQQVHVDQTAAAAAARVRRHLPLEAEELLGSGGGRYAIINVWRPIEYAAVDVPLAVVDWKTTDRDDYVAVDLLYPKRAGGAAEDEDDRGKEKLPDPETNDSVDGYEPRGEHFQVAPNESHRFYFQKDMTPEEALLIKCYDSFGHGEPRGVEGLAVRTPHSAFRDGDAPENALPRQSIEVRCLVFYE